MANAGTHRLSMANTKDNNTIRTCWRINGDDDDSDDILYSDCIPTGQSFLYMSQTSRSGESIQVAKDGLINS